MDGLTFSSEIPLDQVSGLEPTAVVVLSGAFAREEVKRLFFRAGRGLTSEAITNLQSFCLSLLSESADRVLAPESRQEILQVLLKNRRVMAHLPELRLLRRQRGFLKKLDRSLQSGRLTYAHEEEKEVHLSRLMDSLGKNPLRLEVRKLALAYEPYLAAQGLFDGPRLIQEARKILESGWPEAIPKPEKIFLFCPEFVESLEAGFWEVVERWVAVERKVDLPQTTCSGTVRPSESRWEIWHTLDDAADALAERLSQLDTPLREHAIVIPDQMAVRRSLMRALQEHGIPTLDERDPSRTKMEEAIKWSLLPLEVVATQFERKTVCAFLRNFAPDLWSNKKMISEIHSRGIRRGLAAYRGGFLEPVFDHLQKLQDQFPSRSTVEELSSRHLHYLANHVTEDRRWLVGYFESFWKLLSDDLERLGLQQTVPAAIWLSRLQRRLEQHPPPIQKVRPRDGVKVDRLQQVPVTNPQRKQVWIFGLPAGWLGSEILGDYWYSSRDRDILSGDFLIRSSNVAREERSQLLRLWAQAGETVHFLDAQVNWDGKERESLQSIMREMGFDDLEPQRCGASNRWRSGFGMDRPSPPIDLELPPLVGNPKLWIEASALDRYSKCGFQGLTTSRWRLRDLRDPDIEMWPDARGNILHRAVEILLLSRKRGKGGVVFEVSAESALERAWLEKRPRGLLQGMRVEAYSKRRMVRVLDTFLQAEKIYADRSETEVFSLEDPESLELRFGDIGVRGRADRIDRHEDGLMVIDYKTSSVLPSGVDMVEDGVAMQLPFYAIAAEKRYGQPVLGTQFIQLNAKGARTRGIFFKKYNGKESGMLTHHRARSSLFSEEPAEIWAKLEVGIQREVVSIAAGRLSARPQQAKECVGCVASDVCGFRRRADP